MDSNDKVVEKTELVIDAIDYAQKHNLDINNKVDVKKILDALDPEHTNLEEVEEFMNLLQHADAFMEVTAAKKDHEKTDLPN